MLKNANEKRAIKQIALIGVTFLMAGLGVLIIFSEPTPLLLLGIVFTLSPFIGSGSQSENNHL